MLLFANADITIENSVCFRIYIYIFILFIYIYLYYTDIYDKKPFIKQSQSQIKE